MRTIDVGDFVGAFSALLDAADRGEPTAIMKAGRPIAVLTPPGNAGHDIEVVHPNFGNFLLSFPGGLEDSLPKLVASEL